MFQGPRMRSDVSDTIYEGTRRSWIRRFWRCGVWPSSCSVAGFLKSRFLFYIFILSLHILTVLKHFEHLNFNITILNVLVFRLAPFLEPKFRKYFSLNLFLWAVGWMIFVWLVYTFKMSYFRSKLWSYFFVLISL